MSSKRTADLDRGVTVAMRAQQLHRMAAAVSDIPERQTLAAKEVIAQLHMNSFVLQSVIFALGEFR